MARPLTEQQKSFCYNIAVGMIQTQAARAAGYKFPDSSALVLLKQPAVIEQITKEQAKWEKTADMTRKKVIDGLQDAIQIARLQADAQAMVAGWREIARICGYYAPEQKKINITVSGAVQLSQIEDMSDEELAKLIIEGEATRLPDEDDAVSEEVLALTGPSEGVEDAAAGS
jgi:Terminase small subunit